MNEKRTMSYDLIAGILFVAVALHSLMGLKLVNAGFFPTVFYIQNIIVSLLSAASFIVLSVSMFTKRRDVLPCVGFGVLALAQIISLIFYDSAGFSFLLGILGYIAVLLVSLALLTEYLPMLKENSKKFWYMPAVLIAARTVVQVLYMLVNFAFFRAFTSLFWGVIEAGAFFLACAWCVCPDGIPNTFDAKTFGGAFNADEDGTEPSAPNFTAYEQNCVLPMAAYCSLVKHVLLLIFTFGIWYLIWIYKMTGFLNAVKDEEPRNPTTKLLLCMFVPFYSIYWIYKSAQRIDKLSGKSGASSDFSTICLVLAIFVSIIPPILMQDKVNGIVMGKTQNMYTAQNSQTSDNYSQNEQNAASVNNSVNIPNELKEYKALLDEGVITQEEFDAKKKQLLGL